MESILNFTSSIQRKEVMKINISEYARLNNISWSTAKRRLQGKLPNIRKKRSSCLDPFIEIIKEKRDRYLCSAKSIYDFIKSKYDFNFISYSPIQNNHTFSF